MISAERALSGVSGAYFSGVAQGFEAQLMVKEYEGCGV